jgi:hypothetical protein
VKPNRFGRRAALYCGGTARISLKAFDEVVPAMGSTHSAVRVSRHRD